MADFTIDVTLDASGVKSGANAVRSEVRSLAGTDLKALESRLKSVGSTMQSVGQALSGLGRSLTVAVTAPLTALATLGIKSALALDTNRTKLTALLGSLDAANARIKVLQELSKTAVGVTTQGAVAIDTQMRAAGISSTQVIDGMIQSLGELNAAFKIEDQGNFLLNLGQIFNQGFEIADIKEAIGRVPIFRELLKRAFGTDDPEKLRDLKNSGKLTLETFMSGLTDAMNNDPRIANIQENLQTKLAKGWEQLSTALAPIGDVILRTVVPAFQAIVPYIQSAAEWFQNLGPAAQTVIVVIGAMAAAAGPLLIALGAIVGAIGSVITVVGALAGAGPVVGIVAAAIAGLAIQMAPLIAWAAALYVAWQTNFGGIRDLTAQVLEAIKAAWVAFSAEVQQLVGELTQQIKEFWDANGEDVMRAVQQVSDFIKSIWQEVAKFWAEHGDAIKAFTAEMWENIKVVVKVALDVILNTIKLVTAIINGDWGKAWQAFKAIVADAMAAIAVFIKAQGDVLLAAVKAAFGVALSINIWLIKEMVALGKAVVDGLVEGIQSGAGRVGDAARALGQRAIAGVKSSLNIQSPSKVMHGMGVFVTAGLANGIDAGSGQVGDAAIGLGNTVIKGLKMLVGGDLQDFLSNVFNIMTDRTKSFGDKLRSLFGMILDNWKQMLGGIVASWGRAMGGNTVSGNFGIGGGFGSGSGSFGGFGSAGSSGGFRWPGDRTGTIDAAGNYVVDGRSRWKQLTGAGGIFGSQGFGNNVGTYGAFGAMAGIAGGLIGGRVGGFISGAGAGLSMGAMIGSMIAPGIGTAIGAVVGAIGGGLISLLGGDPKRKKDKRENIPALQKGFQQAIADLERLKNDRMAIYNDPDGALSRARDIRTQIAAGFGIEFLSKKYRKVAQQQIAQKLIEADKLIAELEQVAGSYKYARQVDERLVTSFAGGVFMSQGFMSQFRDFKKRNGFLGGRFTGSDTLPSMLAPGEMVLNPYQVARVKANAGMDPFTRAGIPGYAGGAIAGSSAAPMSGAALTPSIVVAPTVEITIEGEGISDARIKSVVVDGMSDTSFQVSLAKATARGAAFKPRSY